MPRNTLPYFSMHSSWPYICVVVAVVVPDDVAVLDFVELGVVLGVVIAVDVSVVDVSVDVTVVVPDVDVVGEVVGDVLVVSDVV